MPRKKQNRGVCVYCGAAYALGGMLKHLTACPQRQAAITAASETAGAKKETLYLMRVRDVYVSCAGRNRQGVVGESPMQTRNSEPVWPRVMHRGE